VRTRRWLWAFVAFSFLVPTIVNGATLQGQLVYASGAPSAYVALRLNSNSRGPSEFVYSGGDGRFYLKNIPAGNYTLAVWLGKKVATSVSVRVAEPTTTLPAIRLP
jgi:hypothetical protein